MNKILTTKHSRLVLSMKRALRRADFNPINEIVRLYPELSSSEKKDICLELLKYTQPKLKEITFEPPSTKADSHPQFVDITHVLDGKHERDELIMGLSSIDNALEHVYLAIRELTARLPK